MFDQSYIEITYIILFELPIFLSIYTSVKIRALNRRQNRYYFVTFTKPHETTQFQKETNQVELQEEYESHLSISLPA